MKSILVSGAGSGIGQAISVKLAQLGWSVILMGRHEKSLNETLDRLDHSDAHHVAVADIRDHQSINKALESTQLSSLNAVVANAGIGGENKYGAEDRWSDILDTNLTGTYYLVNEALPLLKASKEKLRKAAPQNIILISSVLARLGVPQYSAYCSSKAGLLGLMRSWASEFASDNILVNALCPGWVETEMATDGLKTFAEATDKTVEQIYDEQMQNVPLGKMSQPEEIADFIAFLLSDTQTSITGQTFDINNGALMPS